MSISHYKGDNIGPRQIHIRLGKASKCDIDISHQDKRFEWANKNHSVSINKDDYVQLCCSCHRIFDKSNADISYELFKKIRTADNKEQIK
jgi:hypothetical protein